MERVERGGLAALVSRVPLAEFGEEPLRRNLNDLGWLERVARGHEAVLERALEHATIVPVRLCTIFDDERGRGAHARASSARTLAAALDALAGRSEWSVKLLVDRAALEAAARGAEADRPASRRRPAAGPTTCCGAARSGGCASVAERIAAELAEDVHARLRELRERRRRRARPRTASCPATRATCS